jgi:carbonyl reductase 1
MAAAPRAIVVTGASAGIGLALCRQLLVEEGCRVFMGVRSLDRGAAALATLSLPADAAARASLVLCDTTSDASCAAAAAAVRAALGPAPSLFALVNNAGVGLAHGVPLDTLLNTNLHGPMRVTAAFLPLLAAGARVVNLGSGSGTVYVKKLIDSGAAAEARALMAPASAAAVLAHAEAHKGGAVSEAAYSGYGLSKACLHAWTQVMAREHPELTVLACSPGFIATSMTAGYGGAWRLGGGGCQCR